MRGLTLEGAVLSLDGVGLSDGGGGLDRTAGYTDSWNWQAPPAGRLTAAGGIEAVPTSGQWPVIAAVWLLAAWTAGTAPGWHAECVLGTAPSRDDQPWAQPPADLSDFPFPPGTADVLIALLQAGPRQPFEPSRPPAEVTAELAALLSSRIPATDPRGTTLLGHLAGLLTGRYTDLLRIDSPGVLDLIQRESRGRALHLTIAPAAEPPAVDLRTRLACLITLLSTQLWVNNNNPVTFRVWLGPRGDTGPATDVATDWWTRTREDEPDGPPELRAISVDELDSGLYTIVRSSLLDLFDDSWDGIDEWPPVPPGHLALDLYRDLLDLLLAHTAGPDGPPQLLCTGYLPQGTDLENDDDDYYGTVVFVGPTDVAVLDLDLNC